jgi:hypothetical protein
VEAHATTRRDGLIEIHKELGHEVAPDLSEEFLIKNLAQLRTEARKNKNYPVADLIRLRLSNLGITLEDKQIWLSIQYRGFSDVPLIFLARYKGRTILFDRAFDEALDDYSQSYRVYSMPDLADQDLPQEWTTLTQKATGFLGEIPIAQIRFDPTKRREIETSVIEQLMTPAKAKP